MCRVNLSGRAIFLCGFDHLRDFCGMAGAIPIGLQFVSLQDLFPQISRSVVISVIECFQNNLVTSHIVLDECTTCVDPK